MKTLTYEEVASTFRYDPITGHVYMLGKDTPVTSTTKSGNGIRCQIQSGDRYRDTTAHAVAWVLLTGKDLQKNQKPKHINGDMRDNRAANLYLEICNYPSFKPSPLTYILGDSSLARALYPDGRKENGAWVVDGDPVYEPGIFADMGKGSAYRWHYLRPRAELSGEEFDFEDLKITDLEHFEQWVIQTYGTLTRQQKLEQFRREQNEKEIAFVDVSPQVWESRIDALLNGAGTHSDYSVYQKMENWHELCVKHGYPPHPAFKSLCSYSQWGWKKWKESNFVF